MTMSAYYHRPQALSFIGLYSHIVFYYYSSLTLHLHKNGSFLIYKQSRNDKPIYGYMLLNLSPSTNLYKVQSNNVAL